MRCPNCNKFVSFEEPEVEIQATELSSDQAIVTARIVLKCAECGEELKDAEIESETAIDHECKKSGTDPEFEWEDEPQDANGDVRFEDKDQNGKPITSARYKKTFYGFTCEGVVKCVHCKETINLLFKGDEQASGFNELV